MTVTTNPPPKLSLLVTPHRVCFGICLRETREKWNEVHCNPLNWTTDNCLIRIMVQVLEGPILQCLLRVMNGSEATFWNDVCWTKLRSHVELDLPEPEPLCELNNYPWHRLVGCSVIVQPKEEVFLA